MEIAIVLRLPVMCVNQNGKEAVSAEKDGLIRTVVLWGSWDIVQTLSWASSSTPGQAISCPPLGQK